MKNKNFDIRNLFKKSHDDQKQDEVFDLVERQIVKEKFKRKIKQNEIKSKEILEKINVTCTEPNFFTWNPEILRSEILNFNFDEDCVYDFSENQIKKIGEIDTINYKIEIGDLYQPSNIKINNTGILDSNYDLYQLSNFPHIISPYDKLLFLESKIQLKNQEITREILRTLNDLEDLEVVKDDCNRVYEKLIENGELIEELFDYKRDVRVLSNLNTLSEEYLFEYVIFLNKNILPFSKCECSKCVICKMISLTKFKELNEITTNTKFYETIDFKLTYDQILNLKFNLFNKIKTDDTFYHVLLGFTEEQIFEKLKNLKDLNLYTRVLSLFCKDLKIENDLDLILEAYDKAQSLLKMQYDDGLDFGSHYETFDQIEKNLNEELSLKEATKLLKIRTSSLITAPFCMYPHFLLPLSSIFILKSIFKHKSIPFYLVYEIYDKINKFIIPFSFYDTLFKNQNDFLIHFLRAKELFKLFELTQDKSYLIKCLKYIDKKASDSKSKDQIYKLKLLKSKILLKINCPKEAFYEIQRYKNLEACKILAYSDLLKAIEEISHFKDLKSKLLSLELQNVLREGLEIGMLFNKDSSLDTSIINKYLSLPESQLSFIRYLKYRNLEQAHDFIEKCKNTKDDQFYYESFIIKRKLGLISYRVLYKDRRSDLLNQEINYIENKECDESNEFYYLYLYKKESKKGDWDDDKIVYDKEFLIDFYLKELTKGNGDSLLILRILYDFPEEILLTLKTLHQVENGFYWSRTRKILDFKNRLKHTIEIFEFDQKY